MHILENISANTKKRDLCTQYIQLAELRHLCKVSPKE